MISAAKMVADSTQSDTDSRKRRNKSSRGRHDRRSRRDRRRRRGSRYSSSRSRSRSRSRGSSRSRSSPDSRSDSRSASDEYDSDIDLDKQLKPLKAYLRNPAELLNQMLHSVRGSSLQRALPEALKEMPMEDLRRRCLEHLEVLSRKRTKRILAGDDPGAISSSCTEDDKSTDEEANKENEEVAKADSTEEGKEKEGQKKDKDGEVGGGAGDAAAGRKSPLSLGDEELDYQDDLDNPHDDTHPQDDDEYDSEEGWEGEEAESGEEGKEGGKVGAEDVAGALFPDVEQDKMELLELEMRARAIKAMLALHEQREKEVKKTSTSAKPKKK